MDDRLDEELDEDFLLSLPPQAPSKSELVTTAASRLARLKKCVKRSIFIQLIPDVLNWSVILCVTAAGVNEITLDRLILPGGWLENAQLLVSEDLYAVGLR